jgi:hypothetical protein
MSDVAKAAPKLTLCISLLLSFIAKKPSAGNYLLGQTKAPMTGRTGKNTTLPFDRFSVPYEEIDFPPLADGTKVSPFFMFWAVETGDEVLVRFCGGREPHAACFFFCARSLTSSLRPFPSITNENRSLRLGAAGIIVKIPRGCRARPTSRRSAAASAWRFTRCVAHDEEKKPASVSAPLVELIYSPSYPYQFRPLTQQSAFGLLSNVSCLGTETDRPFCYVKKGSCPKSYTPSKSDYYPNSAYSEYAYCQPYTQAVKAETAQRTRNGCLCLEQVYFYDQVLNGGTCVSGQRQFPGRLRCFVDPKTCDPKLMRENGGPYPSVLYRDMYIDLCD